MPDQCVVLITGASSPERPGWRACATSINCAATDPVVVAAPLKIDDGSGSPLRVIAIPPA